MFVEWVGLLVGLCAQFRIVNTIVKQTLAMNKENRYVL